MTGAEVAAVESEAGALEADPVAYMAVVLHRAKGWLAEATSIDEVRHAKAVAVGYEAVIREKELAFDAQLSATELVRRCERRIGQLARQGQEQGQIARRGDIGGHPSPGLQRGGDLVRVTEFVGVDHPSALTPLYAMADVPPEHFEEAIADARSEGNLSRANVVRKVKGDLKPEAPRSEWHHKKRHIDSNRIVEQLALEMEGAAAGPVCIRGPIGRPAARSGPSIRRRSCRGCRRAGQPLRR